MSTRPNYQGAKRNLVLAFDVGTTFSGISYAILEPGMAPEIKSVTRFPHQAHIGGDAKIPTVIYYNREGQIQAMGAETTIDSTQDSADQEQWHKAEWFKLHFRPENLAPSLINMDIRPLPPNKTATQVLSDFLRYLLLCAREFITEAHPNGIALWNSVKDTMEFVLTHPNGWAGRQQTLIRRAAVLAELIGDTLEDHSRISFATEGEASLHYCIQHGLSKHVEAAGRDAGIVVVDAGGGTVDISAYSATGDSKGDFQEICEPQCHFAGSVLVTLKAEEYISNKLNGSRFEDDIPRIVDIFDKKTKLNFRQPDGDCYIKFGSVRDSVPELNVSRGQLKIPGTVVAGFFDPSIMSIVQVVTEHIKPNRDISAIFLVGGFAASDYLFSRLKNALEPTNVTFCRPDSHMNKAVAEGAVSYSIDHAVSRRVARMTYGLRATTSYDPTDVQHKARENKVVTSATGQRGLPDRFHAILHKGVSVSEEREFRRDFRREVRAEDIDTLKTIREKIVAYQGNEVNPTWMDIDPASYPVTCIIVADMRECINSLKPYHGLNGGLYYLIAYDIILSFGTTELKAQVAWQEDGVEKRGPARIVHAR